MSVSIESVREESTDRFFYGWRYVEREVDGRVVREQVPLTEWDVLHPQEEDFIVQNDAHSRNCSYAAQALEDVLASRPDTHVFFDHRIDWQAPGIIPHGPDVVAVGGLSKPWVADTGTFRVKDRGATILVVVEVTSPTTRDLDFDEKVVEYHAAGVPYYIIVDSRVRAGVATVRLIGYEATDVGFRRMTADPELGLWVPTVELWFGTEGETLICRDANKVRIPWRREMRQELDQTAAQLSEALRNTAELEAEVARLRAAQAPAPPSGSPPAPGA